MIDEATRWDDCEGDYFLAVCNDHPSEHEPTVVPLTCGLRICPRCVKRDRNRVVKTFDPLFKAVKQGRFPTGRYGYRFKHLVLTARREEGDLRGQLQRLMKNARKLIKHFWARKGWRGRGAVVTAEIGPKGGNVHVHAFLYGGYVDQKKISKKWEQLTGGKGCVVWIRACDVKGLKEVIKYPFKLDGISAEEAVNYLVALHGYRRMHTWGIFYNGKYRDTSSGDGIKCAICGSSTTIMSVDFYEEKFGIRVAHMPKVVAAIKRLRGGRGPP